MTETDNHKGTWYFDFLNACLDDPDGYNSSIPRFINPDFKEELSKIEKFQENY
jgi:hypothetical protein